LDPTAKVPAEDSESDADNDTPGRTSGVVDIESRVHCLVVSHGPPIVRFTKPMDLIFEFSFSSRQFPVVSFEHHETPLHLPVSNFPVLSVSRM
jgi:hypothetical protein